MDKIDSVFDEFDISLVNRKDECSYIRTNVLPFDMLTQGRGLPEGRLVSVYSPPGSGKTTLLLYMARALCLKGIPVLYIAVEPNDKMVLDLSLNQFDKKLFRLLDVLYYNELQKVIIEFFKSDTYKVCIIDSITALSFSEDTFEEKLLESSAWIGSDARVHTHLFRYLSGKTRRTKKTVIYVCQTRANIDINNSRNSGGDKQAGGRAVQFYADLIVKMAGAESITYNDLYGKAGNFVVAKKGYLMAEKNRHAPPFVKIPFYVLFGKGISNKEMLKIWLKFHNYYDSKGAWFVVNWKNYKDVKLQGRAGFNQWIDEHLEELLDAFYQNAEALFEHFQDPKVFAQYIAKDIDDEEAVKKVKQKLENLELNSFEEKEIIEREIILAEKDLEI